MDIISLPRNSNLKIDFGYVQTPYGRVLMAFSKDCPCAIHFINKDDSSAGVDELKRRWPSAVMLKDQRQAIKQLQQLGKKDANILVAGTLFQIRVWRELLKIPSGTLVSYQDIAKKTGRDKAFRAVGTAIGQNPLAMLIPCHRVIHKTGKTTGYRWGGSKKTMMIQDEAKGVGIFPPDRIIDIACV